MQHGAVTTTIWLQSTILTQKEASTPMKQSFAIPSSPPQHPTPTVSIGLFILVFQTNGIKQYMTNLIFRTMLSANQL